MSISIVDKDPSVKTYLYAHNTSETFTSVIYLVRLLTILDKAPPIVSRTPPTGLIAM